MCSPFNIHFNIFKFEQPRFNQFSYYLLLQIERDSVGRFHSIVLRMHHCTVEFKVNVALEFFTP